MTRYRKKPLVVDAYLLGSSEEPPGWLKRAITAGHVWNPRGNPSRFEIATPEGTMFAKDGDWLIEGVEGEIYPCLPSIFEKTYEPIDE